MIMPGTKQIIGFPQGQDCVGPRCGCFGDDVAVDITDVACEAIEPPVHCTKYTKQSYNLGCAEGDVRAVWEVEWKVTVSRTIERHIVIRFQSSYGDFYLDTGETTGCY